MDHRTLPLAAPSVTGMETMSARVGAWHWGSRIATWGLVALAAALIVAVVGRWSPLGVSRPETVLSGIAASLLVVAGVAGLQRRWTCTAAALAAFALGSMLAMPAASLTVVG